jgi:hypothetical protein
MAAKTEARTTVSIVIPRLDDENSGMKMDQYEHVTINGETTLIKRGEHVDVTPEVFIQLKNKFPYI